MKTVNRVKLDTHPPAWMQQYCLDDDRFRGWSGAASGEYICCGVLETEAWGLPGFDDPRRWQLCNSGLFAFPYLWRRFGPPTTGSDDHKELATYYLGTSIKDLLLWVSPRGGRVGTGYLMSPRLNQKIDVIRHWCDKMFAWCQENGVDYGRLMYNRRMSKKARKDYEAATAVVGPFPPSYTYLRNWREAPRPLRAVNQALIVAMRELLRPVLIRDVPINILGHCNRADYTGRLAQRSKYAGYPVPVNHIELD